MATEKKDGSSAKKNGSASFWKSRKGFLTSGWKTLVAKQKPRKSDGAWLRNRFAFWSADLPVDVAHFLDPLNANHAPRFARYDGGSDAPAFATGNRAEAYVLAAQKYRPLWAEIFAGAIEIGVTGSGDIWMYGHDFRPKPEPARIHLYAHEGDTLGAPEAENLETFLFRATLFASEGELDKKGFAAARAELDGHVGTAEFEDELGDFGDFEIEDAASGLFDRASWLIRLLSESDPSDAEIRGAVSGQVEPLTNDDVEQRLASFQRVPLTGFYFGFAAFFMGNDEVLMKIIDLTSKSKSPLITDLSALLKELHGGRKSLGLVTDMPALRKRVVASRLFEPRGRDAALSPEAQADVARAAKEKSLEELAWQYTGEQNLIAAIEESWQSDPAIKKSLAMLPKLRKKDGYRDEDALAKFVATFDPRIEPILIARALDSKDTLRMILLDVLADRGSERAIAALASVTTTVNRFHLERRYFVRLVHNVGDAKHAEFLTTIVKANPPKKDEGARDEMLANAVLALGDLGNAAAIGVITPLAKTGIDTHGTDTAIGLADAAWYALGELGATDVVQDLLARAKKDPMHMTAGACWALGHAAANADQATKDNARKQLESMRISNQSTEDANGKVWTQSIASLFDEKYMRREKEIAREIAIESSLVVLGADQADLATLVSTVLKEWKRRADDDSSWSGYGAHGMLAWALIALRHHPSIGIDLAKPFLTSDRSGARTLARRALRKH